ncbi:outer membrane protein assembly factor BamE [Planctobacterium marinum]|uniref:outer membrane protein assembly factor BamE n=1 Tax=Planctobacterium marinum TaxID=1631968 RepID=UPI001E3F137C|nr:outer membrane protein assembly factor BamE [Planctobacterium marinum]MCC2607347.1 outer membrane protein assembly factor BamE [Planctobacterium marinum]
MKLKLLLSLILAVAISGCSSWIYRIDVGQGNYVIQDDVDKLRIGMTKEQVQFVLGAPVLRDSFDENTYYYIYKIKRGMKSRGEDFRKDLVLHFDDGKLAKMTGDFDEPEDFNTPLDI